MYKNSQRISTSIAGQSLGNPNRLIHSFPITTGTEAGNTLVVAIERTSSTAIAAYYIIYTDDQFQDANFVTTYTAVTGTAPTSSNAIVKNGIDSCQDRDGNIHLAWLDNNGGAGGVYYAKISVTSAGATSWNAKEVASATVPATSSSEERVSITCDGNNVPHVVWAGVASGAGEDRIWYTNRIGGTWVAEAAVASDETDSGMALRFAGGVLGLFYSPNTNATLALRTKTPSATTWSGIFDVSAATSSDSGTGVDSVLTTGIGGTNWYVADSKNTWHILGSDFDDASIVYAYAEIPASENPRVEYNDRSVFSADDWQLWDEDYLGYANATTPVLSVSEDGEAVAAVVLYRPKNSSTRETFFQRTRFSRSEGFEPGLAYPVYSTTTLDVYGFGITSRIANDRAFLVFNDSDADSISVALDLIRPDTAGLTHDVVLDGQGYMLAGPMNKVDITASIPRISIATEQKKQFDFSELDTFGQESFHQGRGEKYLVNPMAFADSDNVLTHIPNQVTLALKPYWAGRIAASLVTEDATATTATGTTSSINISPTLPTTANAMIAVHVFLPETTTTVASITVAATTTRYMTQLGRVTGTGNAIEVWYISAAELAATTCTVTLSGTPSGTVRLAARVFYGVHPSNPVSALFSATGSSTTPSVNATGVVANELTVDAMCAVVSTTTTEGAGQTAAHASAASLTTAGSREASSGTVTMSWTLGTTGVWTTVAYSVRPGAASFTGTPVKFLTYNSNFHALVRGTTEADNALYTWDNTNTEFDRVTMDAAADTIIESAGADPMDTAVYGQDLFIALGESVNMVYFDLSANAWKDGQQPARALVTWDGKLWRGDNLNGVYYSTDPDAAVPTWTLAANIKDTDSFITKMLVYQDALFVFKEDTVVALERAGVAGTYTAREISDETLFRDVDASNTSRNGVGAFVDRGLLFWNRREQVVRFDGSTTTLIGPERGAEALGGNFIGLPSDEVSDFREFATDGNFIYGALKPTHDTSNVYPQLMVYNSVGWHSFWKGVTLGANIETVFFLSIRATSGLIAYPTLWFGDGTNIRYIKLPRNSFNPLDDSTLEFVSSGFLNTAVYDAGLPQVDKAFGEIQIEQLLPSTYAGTVTVRTRLNELNASSIHTSSGNWWTIQAIQANATTIKLPIGEPNDSPHTVFGGLGEVSAKKIELQITLTGSGGTQDTPVVRSYAYRFIAKPQERFGWTVPVKVYKTMTRLDDRDEEVVPQSLRHQLYSTRTSPSPVTFSDGEQDTRILANRITDPAFRVTGFATEIGTVATNSFCTLHKKYGERSQYISISSTSEAGVYTSIGTPEYYTSIYASVYVLNTGSFPVYLQLRDGTSVRGEQAINPSSTWQLAEVTWDHGVAAGGDWTALRLAVVAKARTDVAQFHLSGAQLIFGTTEPQPYIDGDQPRCYWTSTPNASVSARRPNRIVYVTGISEVFRFRKTDASEPSYDSEVTLQLREVL